MKAWLQQHWLAFFRTLTRLAKSPLNTFLSLLAIGIAMTLPAAGYVALDNFETLGKNAAGAPQLSLFMKTDAPTAAKNDVEAHLEQRLPGQWRFVSKAEALARLQNTEELGDLAASLPSNPLPDAFVIEPKIVDPEALEALKNDLAILPGVAHAQLDSAWLLRFAAFLRLGRLVVDLLAGVFAVGLVAVTFNTIRLQVLAQADEIEVIRLIGATEAFIRRPFYYSGVVQGMLGGVIADLLLAAGIAMLQTPVAELAELYGSSFRLAGLAASSWLLPPLVGGGLGWLGARLSVNLAAR